MLIRISGGKESISLSDSDLLGAASLSLCWRWQQSLHYVIRGRAQKTRQLRGSSNPGYSFLFSSRRRNGSMITSPKSDARNLALCCAFLRVLWVEYKACISVYRGAVSETQ